MKNNHTTDSFATDETRIAEANRRLDLINAYLDIFNDAKKRGMAASSAQRTAYVALSKEVSRTSLDRYLAKYSAKGFDGLIPGTARCGRKSTVAKVGMTEEDANQIAGLRLDTGSTTAACRLFAQSDRCPADLAAAILDSSRTSKHSIPQSIRAAINQRVNGAVENAHRGPRALSLRGMWTPRKNDILPGDIFSSDDTTPIWAWWVPWRADKEYPFGVKVLQGQFLPIIDVASQCIVSFVLIAREASSYRACDIWSLFGHTFDQIGLPRLGFQLERGSWEANKIRGEELEFQEGEVTLSRRIGGLRQLPVNLTDWHRRADGPFQGSEAVFPKNLHTWTSYLPKSKSIEAAFNRMQTFEGTLWGALGRNQQKNPFEKTKKIFEACKRGSADPREHFLSGVEMAAKVRGILEYLNNEPMEGEVFRGVPRAIFDQAVTERPLFRMPEELAYLYRRDWKSLQIVQGYARVRLTHPVTGARFSLFYSNPAVFAGREGEAVIAYYDRENFERPAQIHSARTGEFLCEAPYVDRRGSFLDGDQTGHELRRAWKNAVMGIYGTLAPHAPSRQMPAEITNRRANAEAIRTVAPEPAGRGQAEPLATRPGTSTRGAEPADEESNFKGNLRMQMLQASE